MAQRQYVLAIDQGTTGTHVAILDSKLKLVGEAYREFRQIFPAPGWVEHDLDEIWRSVETCIAKGLQNAGIRGNKVAAIGITNQRETTGLWDRESGKPVHHAIVWQDRRTADRCAELKAQGEEARVRAHTGLVLDPYFSGTKLTWLLSNVTDARARAERGELCFGTVDTWLVYKLTGKRQHVTDSSNASRTLLMNLRTQGWDPEMCALHNVTMKILPQIRGSAEVYGETRGIRSLPDGIPIAGMAGDQQAALFGQACFAPGDAKCTYGTGAFLLLNTGAKPVESQSGLLTTVAWTISGQTTYALEGSSFIAGAAVQWLRDGLKLVRKASEIEALAKRVRDAGAVVFVPALAGLGAPHWRPEARGLIAGLDRSTTAAHLARAVLEGIALQIHDLLSAMQKDSGQALSSLKVDGGAAANDLLMQFQADILGTEVVRPKNLQSTAVGAALLGGLGAGLWPGAEHIRSAWKAERTFKPKMSAQDRERHLAKWRRAVERA
jgi:glycerol kinase